MEARKAIMEARKKVAVERLRRMGRLDCRFDALYRRVCAVFGLPACALWVLYHLLAAGEEGLTQRDLAGLLMFPKQTVNSAVSRLAREGWAEVGADGATRKSKRVRLTAEGRARAEGSAGRLLRAEIRAVRRFGAAKARALDGLREEFFGLLEEEFAGDFLKEEP